jgi:hypothetical protein
LTPVSHMWDYGPVTVAEFRVRMPPALHQQLKTHALEQDVSLNQLCVALLAGGIGFRLTDSAAIGAVSNAELEAQLSTRAGTTATQ